MPTSVAKYEPVVTCARHHQTLHVGGASAHRDAGVFELTSPETSGWSLTAHIHEHLVERISRTTLAPIKASIARWPSQYRAETDSHIAERKFPIHVACLAQSVDLMGGAP